MSLFSENGIDLSSEQKVQFEKLCESFIEWNSKINLSAIRDKAGIYEKHFLDSLLPTKYVEFSRKKTLDLGAGGGFPCLPLAVFSPTAQISALDSVGKKMKAVQAMGDELGLKNLKTFHGRIEDFGQDKVFRERFDLVTARALAPWPVLLEYALPFVKVGGLFAAYQGPQIHEDLKIFEGLEKKLGGKIEAIYETALGDSERVFVIIKKIATTHKQFPRANGIPRNQPLS